jgi:hypothetical protein
MSDLLVRAQNHWRYKETMTPAERIKYDAQISIGDIVSVHPDGQLGEHAHAGGKFYVFRVKGLDKSSAIGYMQPIMAPSLVSIALPEEIVKRRLFKVDLSLLPVESMEKLAKDFAIDTTVEEFSKWIYNKETSSVIK